MSEAAEVTESLTSRVGPLPAWGWGAIALALYFGYEHFYAGSHATTADTSTNDSGTSDGSGEDTSGTDSGVSGLYDDSTDESGGDYGDPYAGTNGDAGGVIYGSTETGTVVTTYATNQQWLIAAINALRSQGDSASLATTALTLYLKGQKLTANEAQYVNAAIQSIGPPPNPLPIRTGAASSNGLTAPVVKLVSKTSSSIKVSWTGVKGATSYQVNHDGKVLRSVGRSYTLRGLKAKSSHTITVRAAKGSTLGPPSNHLQVVTK